MSRFMVYKYFLHSDKLSLCLVDYFLCFAGFQLDTISFVKVSFLACALGGHIRPLSLCFVYIFFWWLLTEPVLLTGGVRSQDSFLACINPFSSIIYWRDCHFSTVCPLLICEKSVGRTYMGVVFGLLFFLIGLCVLFYANQLQF